MGGICRLNRKMSTYCRMEIWTTTMSASGRKGNTVETIVFLRGFYMNQTFIIHIFKITEHKHATIVSIQGMHRLIKPIKNQTIINLVMH